MGFMDSLKSSCTKMAKQAVKEAMEGDSTSDKAGASSSSRAPSDPEAYAKKVAETIQADVRCAPSFLGNGGGRGLVLGTAPSLCIFSFFFFVLLL